MQMLDCPQLSIVTVTARGVKLVRKALRTLLNPFWLCRSIRNFFVGHVDTNVPPFEQLARSGCHCLLWRYVDLSEKSSPSAGRYDPSQYLLSVPQAGDNRTLG